MNTKISAQIKKGVLEMCLLHKLSQQDYYGYNLMHERNNRSNDVAGNFR
ncbi:transcriptional regulator PadR-like family [Clostridium sp. CAG:253]|nr:transcriptional regulator PadR-like family [Clostridium sp. CAG:253]